MKATLQVKQGLSVELEAEKQTELFEGLASVQEVFGEKVCVKCGKPTLKFVVRQDGEENKYYELHCTNCYAKLAFGVHKKGGTLFPKRKDDDEGSVTGNANGWLPDKGWLRWDKEKQKLV